MHADLLARQVPGATRRRRLRRRPRGGAGRRGPRAYGLARGAARTDVDAVAICSSTETHADLIVAAARAGKAIFCEKPISLDLAEVDRALAAVDEAGVPFQIGFNRRFDPAHAGRARRGRARRRRRPAPRADLEPRPRAAAASSTCAASGGIFLDMTIHDFDMARFVTGSEVVEVFARGAVRVDPAFGDAGDVDTALVTLVHANGCLTAIDNSRQAVYGYDQRVEVFGSRGMAASENPLRALGGRAHRRRHAHVDAAALLPRALRAELPARVGGVRAAPCGPARRRRSRARDARAPLVIGLAAWQSLREGRPVRVEEVTHEGLDHRRQRVRRLAPGAGVRRRLRAVARRGRRHRRRRGARAASRRTAPDAIVHAAILNDFTRLERDGWRGVRRRDAQRASTPHAAARRSCSSRPTGCSTDAARRTEATPPNPINLLRRPQGGERAGGAGARRAAPSRGSPPCRACSDAPRQPGRRASATSSPRSCARCAPASASRSGRATDINMVATPTLASDAAELIARDRRRRPHRDLPLLRRRGGRPAHAGRAHRRGVRPRRATCSRFGPPAGASRARIPLRHEPRRARDRRRRSASSCPARCADAAARLEDDRGGARHETDRRPGAGALPRRAGDRARRRAPALLRRLLRHLRPRQHRRPRPGAPAAPGPAAATTRRRNEQAMVHIAVRLRAPAQPARRLRVHDVGRPGRDQHGHRRGAGDDQPPAGAAAAGRHVRHAARRTRCCSSSRRRTTRRSRSTTASSRCRATWTASTGPSSSCPRRSRRCAC